MSALIRTQQSTVVAIVVTVSVLSLIGSAAAQAREEGVANFYSDKFEGQKTASGEVYNKTLLTAAHKKFPFGTKVKVTNVANGKSVVVTVNDRMAASNKAVIDVTRRAAEDLGFVGSGTAKVTLEVQK